MPAIRIDWQNIKNEVIGNGQSVDEPFLFVLPHGGRHLLMSIIDTLKYQATYRIEGYDYADWDSLLSMVELTHLGLMEGEQVNSIAESITYLADKIAENFPASAISEDSEMINTQTVTINGCGCCGESVTSTTTSGDNLPPDGYDVDNVEPIEPTAQTSDANKCDRGGYLMIQYRNACLTAVQGAQSSYSDFESWFLGLFDWLQGVLPLSYDVFLRLQSWISTGDFTNTDDFLASFDPNYDAMCCAIFQAETASEAKTAVRNILESYVWGEVSVYARLAYKQMFESLPFGMIFDYDTVADLPPGYIGRTCCGSVPEPDWTPEGGAGFYFVPAKLIGSETTNGSASNVSEWSQSGGTQYLHLLDTSNVWGVEVRGTFDMSGIPESDEYVGFMIEHVDMAPEVNNVNIGDFPLSPMPDNPRMATRSINLVGKDDLDAILADMSVGIHTDGSTPRGADGVLDVSAPFGNPREGWDYKNHFRMWYIAREVV